MAVHFMALFDTVVERLEANMHVVLRRNEIGAL